MSVEPHFGANQLNHVFAIGPVHDSERRRQTDMAAGHAQDQIGERMKGAAGNLATAAIDQKTGAPKHFLGGTAREGQQQNRARIDALIDQMGDAINQSAGLARARAGDNEQRAFHRGRRLILRWVKLITVIEP